MWQYNYTDELYHYGVLGMKWGRRKASGRSKSPGSKRGKTKAKKTKTELTPEQKKARNKKIAAGILAGIGAAAVTAGAIYYAKNKGKVDKAVKKFVKKHRPLKKETAAKNKWKKKQKKIWSMSEEEANNLLKSIETRTKLNNAINEQIRPGRKKALEILERAGTSAATTMATGGMLYGVKVAITKKADRKDAGDYITPKPKKK